ncbi:MULTISPECIES: DUF294 nucleotidyltransferase-like domain-containing protein [Nitrincola]|uniref:Putative signal-transduction protein containing cAMP-binding and CBS domain n=1 Tax=Nitrincola nitratireducens TaxID=1229521 RepID=W9UW78_9GAMM|nr:MULTISPECIES: DUF294 nucleotidyltransferase-like domain-containing protein [Nitrincola]EXJ11503.1 putative signal-transduction protein containing cAMP-binding and CBS domain [Nitrincola nitratireducens]
MFETQRALVLGWRMLFSQTRLPDTQGWPDCLSGLASVLSAMSSSDVTRVKALQVPLVEALMELQLPAWHISQILSDHNDWLYRFAIQESIAEMQQQGWGEAPCRFCVLCMGSGARSESLLNPDQDNALIIEDYPDARQGEIDLWFQTLSERFTDKLDLVGIPLCKGHVMARWPLWRKTLSQWCEQFRQWTSRRTVRQVQFSNILLDFKPVFGDSSLADAFREYALSRMPRAGLFLHEMSELLDETPVALDRFERLHGDGKETPHQDAINLKKQGLLPLQAALRLLALRKGVSEQSCQARLAALAEQRVIHQDHAEALLLSLHHIQDLLLHSQLSAFKEGRPIDGWVDLRTLNPMSKQVLRLGLLSIKELQKKARISV